MTTSDCNDLGHADEICDTCWLCPACCPGLENCAIALEAEEDEAMTS